MKILLAVLISFSGFTAQAQPHFEPGPVIKLEEAAIEAVDALLLANATNLQDFIAAGNMTTEVTRQHVKPGVTIYRFLRKRCSLGGITGGICLAGAELRVEIREKRQGSMLIVEAFSTLRLVP